MLAGVRKPSYLCNAKAKTVVVAQLVRASDCGSEGRGFEPRLPPTGGFLEKGSRFFYAISARLFDFFLLLISRIYS